jgi:tRNA dimethylallyltransferase
VAWIGLQLEPDEHRRRIAERARGQFAAGLVEEAVALRERWDPGLPCFSAIGYAEAWAVADGLQTREEAIEADAARNVAFAKRQRTWFRAEPDVTWLDATERDPGVEALATLRRLVDGDRADGPAPSQVRRRRKSG